MLSAMIFWSFEQNQITFKLKIMSLGKKLHMREILLVFPLKSHTILLFTLHFNKKINSIPHKATLFNYCLIICVHNVFKSDIMTIKTKHILSVVMLLLYDGWVLILNSINYSTISREDMAKYTVVIN